MSISDIRQRSGLLFLAVAVGHIVLISAQVNARSGVPLLQAIVFSAFAEVQRGTSAAVRATRHVWDGYVALHRVHEENEALRTEVRDLRVRVQQLRALAAESQALRRTLDFRDRFDLPTRPAEIIGSSAAADFRTVTIDRGTSDGVRTDLAVVAAEGVVGRVVMPSRRAAKVQLIVDRNASVAVVVVRSREQGIAFGTGEAVLRLDFLPSSADVREGDELTTSGVDGVYPPGYVVGHVEHIERTGGAFRAIRVRPAVQFAGLEHVLVVLAPTAAPAMGQEP